MLKFLIAALALVPVAPLAAHEGPTDTPLAIEHVTAIDAVNGVRAKQTVLIRDGVIEAIGDDFAFDRSAYRIVDGTERFLIPGLWDAHVHLAYDADVGWEKFFPLSLAHGITSLRDTGGRMDKLAKARAAVRRGNTPDLYLSGPLIDGAPSVYDGKDGRVALAVEAKNPTEVTAIVDKLAADGVNFLKAYEMLAPDTFAALIAAADRNGLKVAAHSPLQMSAMQTALSGADDLQHLRNLEYDCSDNPAELLSERIAQFAANLDKAGGALRNQIHSHQRGPALAHQNPANCDTLIAALATNDVYQTPTLTVARFFDARLWARDSLRQTFAMLGPEVDQKWQNTARRLTAFPVTDESVAYGRWANNMVVQLHAAGVPLMTGTDAPLGVLTPGVSLHEEFALLAEAGLEPMAILEAATLTPARWFGVDSSQGTIAPGMKADLVLLRANPLDHVSNLRAIDMVVKDGVPHDRAGLDVLFAKARGED